MKSIGSRLNFANLSIPVIQAPMAGGFNNPNLAAAIANAGGVGSFGFAYSSPQSIARDLNTAMQLTSGHINANFFIFNEITLPSAETQRKARDALDTLKIAKDNLLCAELPSSPYFPNLDAQLESVWKCKPSILTFHFGLPSADQLAKAHELDISVGVSATCVEEACLIQELGADFVVAQGIEAGGHRGTFDPVANGDENLPVEELVRRLVAGGITIPIVAAGGIMDGQDIHNIVQAGAKAAQLGTAFLLCDECGTSSAHRRYILNEQHRGTEYTKGFSGRRAQGIKNAFIESMRDKEVFPFPIQNSMTSTIRKTAAKQDNGEYLSLWAGSEFSRARAMPAAALMQTLLDEYNLAFAPTAS